MVGACLRTFAAAPLALGAKRHAIGDSYSQLATECRLVVEVACGEDEMGLQGNPSAESDVQDAAHRLWTRPVAVQAAARTRLGATRQSVPALAVAPLILAPLGMRRICESRLARWDAPWQGTSRREGVCLQL